ncbi:MAG TPA: hypothetical protein VGR14_17310 [Verrucomicrobiae bacterium]|jgi:hypothetical protein|nr:hypothetical protein [Verrucomicrobiae bacterium]
MKILTKLSAILLAAITCAAWPATAQDATAPAPPATTNTAPRPPRNPRYTGVIESIDGTNMVLTLKVANRESKVKVTSGTRITKDRQPATFADAVVGLRVTGSAKKGDDGVLTATTLNIMTKPSTPPPPAATPSQKTE